MRILVVAITAILMGLIGISCSECPLSRGGASELVMREGARLEATAPGGKLAVLAGRGYRRTYEWDGCALEARPCPRRGRWYGNLGIYDAAPGWAYMFRWCSNGISRPVVEEGQLHFANQAIAEWWLTRYASIAPQTTVWTNDGLFVQWQVTPGRDQLGVEVQQLCIGGRRPTILAGASDSAITVSAPQGQSTGRFECAVVSDAVVAETQDVWEKHWREVDEFRARMGDVAHTKP